MQTRIKKANILSQITMATCLDYSVQISKKKYHIFINKCTSNRVIFVGYFLNYSHLKYCCLI